MISYYFDRTKYESNGDVKDQVDIIFSLACKINRFNKASKSCLHTEFPNQCLHTEFPNHQGTKVMCKCEVQEREDTLTSIAFEFKFCLRL